MKTSKSSIGLRLTDNNRNWGVGLCYLYLRNVKVNKTEPQACVLDLSRARAEIWPWAALLASSVAMAVLPFYFSLQCKTRGLPWDVEAAVFCARIGVELQEIWRSISRKHQPIQVCSVLKIELFSTD